MKKFLGIVVITLSFSFNCIADDNIYYCSDDRVVGFNVEKSGAEVVTFYLGGKMQELKIILVMV